MRHDHSNVTLASLFNTLVEKALRDGPAKGLLLNQVELEALC
jgi:hypothetical protein